MLEVKGLSCKSGDIELNNVEFDVDKGDFYVIFGPDDSGKTELFNSIMGVTAQGKGEILYKGKNIRKISMKDRMSIRFVPDTIVVEKGVKGREFIKRYMKMYRVGEVEYMDQLLKYFDIDVDQYLLDMTYECNKMTGILAALLTFPELLIIDEPGNFLSDDMFLKLMKLLKKMNGAGMTVIMAVEHFEEASGYCNRMMYLNDGQVVNKCKIRKDVDIYRKVTVCKGDFKELEKCFGSAVDEDSMGRTYITGLPLNKITSIIHKCKVADKDVSISDARIEDILNISLKKMNKGD